MSTPQDTSFPQVTDSLDRRVSNRVSFDSTFGVAVFENETIPAAEQFVTVHGSDFSHTGISFTTTRWPMSDQLVLKLNSQAKTVYAVARIIGCVGQRRPETDAPRFEVRCEFERWLGT